jgi:hypothetical protein
MAQPKTSVHRVTIHLPSDDLATTIVRGTGYRARSADGWTGPKRRTFREARQDKRAHEAEQAAPVEREDVAPTGGTEAS